jgi:hypothetical protein
MHSPVSTHFKKLLEHGYASLVFTFELVAAFAHISITKDISLIEVYT